MKEELTYYQKQYRKNPDERNFMRERWVRKKWTIKRIEKEIEVRNLKHKKMISWLKRIIKAKEQRRK